MTATSPLPSKPPAAPAAKTEPAPDRRFAAIMTLAREALRLAEHHHTPPVPRAYEVWYSYASGSDDLVSRKINAIIEKHGAVTQHDIDTVHTEVLSSSERERRHIDIANSRFDREMDEIAAIVQSYAASSESYSGSLDRTAQALKKTLDPAQLRRTIELVIAENASMRSETSNLFDRLQQSKAQIDQLRSDLEKSREAEMRDPLTNIANRRKFEVVLEKSIQEISITRKPFCMALVDIDHFKRVNDTFGHMIGDEVIRFVASLLVKNIKGRDLAARFGGEEFALILPATDLVKATRLLDSIRAQLFAANLVVTKSQVPIGKLSASFGIVECRDGDSSDSLINRADQMLYRAKDQGRNCVVAETQAA